MVLLMAKDNISGNGNGRGYGRGYVIRCTYTLRITSTIAIAYSISTNIDNTLYIYYSRFTTCGIGNGIGHGRRQCIS